MKPICYNTFVLALHLLLLPVILIWPSTAKAQSVSNTLPDTTILHGDSIPVVKTVYELAHSDAKKVMLRTNNICFQFVTLHLDTTDHQNRVLLDSIADYLSSHNDVKSVEVDIHLSLKEYDDSYSISLLLYMYEEIISYLGNKGVDTSHVTGKQCYDYYPIIDCNKLSGEECRKCFDNDDFRLNRRVEFVITKR